MTDRVPTGIPGLDELLSGGLPRARSILVAGTCGTGKTTLCAQYLVNGILKYNEPGIFITLEQNSEEIRKDMASFGFDLKGLEEQGKLMLIDTSLAKIGIRDFMTTLPTAPEKSFSLLPEEFDMERIVELVVDASKKIGAKRVAIDSLPALDYMIKDIRDIRRALISMNYELKCNDLTTLVITESLEDDDISKHGVEEYIADGVIVMKTNDALDTRTIKIRKMRLTKHTLKPATFDITPEGLKINPPKGI
jgi:KaiC/GvpD/RAD55 family RecA-like ATPase